MLQTIGVVSLAVVLVVGYLVVGRRPESDGAPGVAASLPLVNACLNATSAALLTAGYVFIRRRRVTAHPSRPRMSATGVYNGKNDLCHEVVGGGPAGYYSIGSKLGAEGQELLTEHGIKVCLACRNVIGSVVQEG